MCLIDPVTKYMHTKKPPFKGGLSVYLVAAKIIKIGNSKITKNIKSDHLQKDF